MRPNFSDFKVLVRVLELYLALNFTIKIISHPLGLYFLLGTRRISSLFLILVLQLQHWLV